MERLGMVLHAVVGDSVEEDGVDVVVEEVQHEMVVDIRWVCHYGTLCHVSTVSARYQRQRSCQDFRVSLESGNVNVNVIVVAIQNMVVNVDF